MSRINFHSASDQAELYGTERAYMGTLIARLSLAVLNNGIAPYLHHDRNPLLRVLPENCHLRCLDYDYRQWWEIFSNWWSVGDDPIIVHGQPREVFALQLNTALVLGGDPLRLLARLHG